MQGLDDWYDALDAQSWGAIFLADDATDTTRAARADQAMAFAETKFKVTQQSVLAPPPGVPASSPGAIAGTETVGFTPYQMTGIEFGAVWGEGSYGVAAAYDRLGDAEKAAETAAGICGLIGADGGVLYAANVTHVNAYGDVFYPYPSIASTGWRVLAAAPYFGLFWNTNTTLYAIVNSTVRGSQQERSLLRVPDQNANGHGHGNGTGTGVNNSSNGNAPCDDTICTQEGSVLKKQRGHRKYTVSLKTTVFVSVDGDDANDGLSATTAMQTLPAAAAILNANPHGGTVVLSAGVHDVGAASTFNVPFRLQGHRAAGPSAASASAGDSTTVLRATAAMAYTWMVLTPLNNEGGHHPGTVDSIVMADVRFDMGNVAFASAVMLGFVSNVVVERCAFVNVGRQGWAMHVGQLNPAHNMFLTTIVNANILVKDCLFDGLEGTLEMLLLTNAQNVVVQDSLFRNAAAGNAIGVYQWTNNVTVRNCSFAQIKTAVYYSLSCNNTLVEDCVFHECQNGIKGALQSDNDCSGILGVPENEAVYPFCATAPGSDYVALFGVSRAHNLTVRDCLFNSSRAGTPLEIGAVENAVVDSCTFEHNDNIAMSISRGGMPVSEANTNVLVRSSHFASTNNRGKQHHLIHPAILVTGPQPDLGLVVEDCTFDFADNQEQIFGVTFAGNTAYGDVCIRRNTFTADSSTGSNFGARGVIFEGNGAVPDDRLPSLLGDAFYVCNNTVIGGGAMLIGPFYDDGEQGGHSSTCADDVDNVCAA